MGTNQVTASRHESFVDGNSEIEMIRAFFRAVVLAFWLVALLALFVGAAVLRGWADSQLDLASGVGSFIALVFLMALSMLSVNRLIVPWFVRWTMHSIPGNKKEYGESTNLPLMLYLRPFNLDNTQLPLPRDHELRNARSKLARTDNKISLEELIVAQFVETHRITAIGHPAELLNPVGAKRVYPAEWQQAVKQLVDEASAIVMCLGDSPGILWELEVVIAAEKLVNTLIVIPPENSIENRKAWHSWCQVLDACGSNTRPISKQARIVFFTHNRNVRFVVFEQDEQAQERRIDLVGCYSASLREVVSGIKLRGEDIFFEMADEDLVLHAIDNNVHENKLGFLPPTENFKPVRNEFEPPTAWGGF